LFGGFSFVGVGMTVIRGVACRALTVHLAKQQTRKISWCHLILDGDADDARFL
jgi:hypothetical protein